MKRSLLVLMLAVSVGAYGNDLNEVQTLIKNGADVNAKNDMGVITALSIALENDYTEIVRLLKEAGARE